ncbi:MAG: hypothetical protein V1798_03925 [Pseudomonadota bacterium]
MSKSTYFLAGVISAGLVFTNAQARTLDGKDPRFLVSANHKEVSIPRLFQAVLKDPIWGENAAGLQCSPALLHSPGAIAGMLTATALGIAGLSCLASVAGAPYGGALLVIAFVTIEASQDGRVVHIQRADRSDRLTIRGLDHDHAAYLYGLLKDMSYWGPFVTGENK